MDWVFSDVICYPPRLYEWVQRWLASGLCKNFVCTIKMQGSEPDFETTRLFAAIPGSTVVHLYHNKHELTWWKLG
jgi:23S rRNA (cytidine2498-2'-O)-methyltransferase